MATDYVIKSGDTLSAIAKKYGVNIGDISGYKSGDANKIYAGEKITIGKPVVDTGTSYVNEMKSQLGSTTPDSSTTKSDSTKSDDYGLSAIRTSIADTTKKRDEAFAALKDISTKTFNDEYTKRGMAEKKAKLTTIDGEIAAAKAARDKAIADVRSNPGLSASQMTGDIKKVADYQNDVINNKIAERNSVAGEYNTELGEINSLVGNKVNDKKLDYGYYDGTLKDLNSQVSDYTKSLRESLADETKADQFDRQLEQALQIATMNANKKGSGGSNLVLKSDPRTGDPLYWFDPDTGEITYIDGEQGASSSGGDTFDNLDTAEVPAANTSSPWYSRLWNSLTGK